MDPFFPTLDPFAGVPGDPMEDVLSLQTYAEGGETGVDAGNTTNGCSGGSTNACTTSTCSSMTTTGCSTTGCTDIIYR